MRSRFYYIFCSNQLSNCKIPVISEVVKSYYNSGKPIDNLYYYRDIDTKEIDLLIVGANCIYPIEIKKSKEPNKPDAHLSALDKFNVEIKPELVICMSEEIIPYNRKCYLVPVAVI